MAISRVGSAQNQVSISTTSVSITSDKPAGLTAGDILVLALDVNRDCSIVTPPTGYTLLRNIVDTSTTKNWIYVRVSDGGGDPTTTEFSQPTAVACVVISEVVAYRGVDNSTPFVVENGTNKTTNASTNDYPAPTLVNTDAGAWSIYHAFSRTPGPANWPSAPTGMTELLDVDGGLTTANNIVSQTADSDGTVATGTYNYTTSCSAAAAAATMWAGFLKPDAGGGGPTPFTGWGVPV